MIQDRFQDQSWYIKLWRLRWYLWIPYCTIIIILRNPRNSFNRRIAWRLAKGLAQSNMKWYYTLDEVRERFKKRKLRMFPKQ